MYDQMATSGAPLSLDSAMPLLSLYSFFLMALLIGGVCAVGVATLPLFFAIMSRKSEQPATQTPTPPHAPLKAPGVAEGEA